MKPSKVRLKSGRFVYRPVHRDVLTGEPWIVLCFYTPSDPCLRVKCHPARVRWCCDREFYAEV